MSKRDKNLTNDDVALVFRPKFTKKNNWDSTVDVSAVFMPSSKLNEDEADKLRAVVYALITCFHLLNTDTDFAARVSERMDDIAREEGFEEYEPINGNNVVHLSSWTKTKGNA